MTTFKTFLEQRDPNFLTEMDRRGFLKNLAGVMGAGALGSVNAQEPYSPFSNNPKSSREKPSNDDPYGNTGGRAKNMLGKKDKVTTDFDLIRDNYGKIIGITFDVKISAYTDPSRISKQDYDPSVSIKKLIYDTTNSEAFRGMKLNLRSAKEIYLNGQRVLANRPLPAFYFLDPSNTILSTKYKEYIDVRKHPKKDDTQEMTITFYFTSNQWVVDL